jgi:hypothetical protein
MLDKKKELNYPEAHEDKSIDKSCMFDIDNYDKNSNLLIKHYNKI